MVAMQKVPIWPFSICEGKTDCFLDCYLSGRVWPMVLFHLILFYGSAAVATVAKWNPKDPQFKNPLYFAHHIPAIGMTIPILSLAYKALLNELLHEDNPDLDRIRYGQIVGTAYQDHISEGMAWFQVFLSVDTVLTILHGLGSAEMYFHHSVFALGMMAQARGGQCCCPWILAALMQQELSTPLLNVFLILRGFYGLGSMRTQGCFLAFALTFFWCRPGFATFATVDFTSALLDTSTGAAACYQSYEMTSALTMSWVGLCLQYYWAFVIGKNLLKGLGVIKGMPEEGGIPRQESKAK